MDSTVTLSMQEFKNADGALSGDVLRGLAALFELDTFIETGTFHGNTAAVAAQVFHKVHTIELSEPLHRAAAERLAGQTNVHLYRGDSASVLPAVLTQTSGNALVWLDAHYSEGDTARGDANTPVLAELDAIKSAIAAQAVILLDDVRLFEPSSQLPLDSSVRGYPPLIDVYQRLLEINPDYQLFVFGDVALAFCGPVQPQVSPVVRACTVSRLYDGKNFAIDDVLAAEQIIADANGDEATLLDTLPDRFSASEALGLGSHYRMWQGLVRFGAAQYDAACRALQQAIALGRDDWRVHWYLARAAHHAGDAALAAEAAQLAQTRLPADAGRGTELGSQAPADHSESGGDTLDKLKTQGLWRDGEALRLHLGCGEQKFPGYINIDFPPEAHDVMTVRADMYADLSELEFPLGSVDEIRSHHLFEHFGRVAALALLIRWHGWLKTGGRLHIETPDLIGSARTLVSDASLAHKLAVVRHLAGDQSADWAYHRDLWFEGRFERTLAALGFTIVNRRNWSWPHPPHLSNVEVTAVKEQQRTAEQQLAAATALLGDSMVSPAEGDTLQVWERQLRDALAGDIPRPKRPAVPQPTADPRRLPELPPGADDPPLADIHDFNQRQRDAWIRDRARAIPPGSRVLDIGAGTCPYRADFSHCRYETHDFKRYEGVKLGGSNDYGDIDHISDIEKIPLPDASFDVVLCTEVLEHVPEPIVALREIARLLKPGGRLLLTAPLGSGLHQLPYHFYGGYTPQWYHHFAPRVGLEIDGITPNGGFFRLLAQESARVVWTLDRHRPLHGEHLEFIKHLFGEWIPRYLFQLENDCFIDQFTVGYHVEASKPLSPRQQADDTGRSVTSAPAPAPFTAHHAVAVAGILFSKDRALQLDAALSSMFRHGTSLENLTLTVLYATSDENHAALYQRLEQRYPGVQFRRQTDFKRDVLALARTAEQILFLVDDNLFVRRFSFNECSDALIRHTDVLGVSLRLGENTRYCYSLDRPQSTPGFHELEGSMLKFTWPGQDCDFGYPLEVSSSLYRAADLLPLLERLDYADPNGLEAGLAANVGLFYGHRPALICPPRSITFCAPINKVQEVCDNRAGERAEHTPEHLADLFRDGHRVDVSRYDGFVPNACHQEIELSLVGDG